MRLDRPTLEVTSAAKNRSCAWRGAPTLPAVGGRESERRFQFINAVVNQNIDRLARHARQLLRPQWRSDRLRESAVIGIVAKWREMNHLRFGHKFQ